MGKQLVLRLGGGLVHADGIECFEMKASFMYLDAQKEQQAMTKPHF